MVVSQLIEFDYFIFLLLTLTILFIVLLSILIFKHNTIVILLLVEIIFLAASLNCIVASYFFDDLVGQVFALTLLTVSAAELAIALSVIVLQYR
jgi:NADH-quinone oxidoreductase subunit K